MSTVKGMETFVIRPVYIETGVSKKSLGYSLTSSVSKFVLCSVILLWILKKIAPLTSYLNIVKYSERVPLDL